MGGGGAADRFFCKKTSFLMTTFRMNLLSARSISLDSTYAEYI